MNFIWAILAGIMTALSMPGMLPGVIIFFSLVPLMRSLRNSKPLMAGISSMIFFFIHLSLSHFWLLDTLTRNLPMVLKNYPSQLGFLVFLLFGFYESLFMFPLGVAVSLISFKNVFLDAVYVASVYTVLEKLRELGDMGFTGGRLSDALYSLNGLVGLTGFVGTLGLVFAVVFVNVLLYRHVSNPRKTFIIVLVLFSVTTVLEFSAHQPIVDKPLEIQVLQTSYDPAEKYSRVPSDLVEKIKPRSGVVFVVPEAFFMSSPDVEKLREISSKTGSLLVIGALDLEGGPHNSVYYFRPDGVVSRYDKIKLFPFVEFLPYPKLFFFLKFLKGLAYYKPGDGYEVIEWNGTVIGGQICFESYFSSISLGLVRSGAQILLIVTNDGWFRSDVALKQHFAKAVFRAAETGRWVVQVANKGITGVVDEKGRIILTLEPGREMYSVFPVQPKTRETFYTRHPNTVWITCLLLCSAAALLRKLRFLS